jgi:hypothetical protein
VSCGKRLSGLNWNFKDKPLNVKEIDFDYFQAKAKMNYRDHEFDVKAKATLRIRMDSVIWMNFTAVGISGGRCLIDKDSLTLINMLKKEYYVFTYEELSKKFNYNINYDVIQSVILGNMMEDINSEHKVERKDEYYQVLQPNDPYLLQCKVNAKTMKLESVDISEKNSPNNARINYSDFQLVNDHAFPYKALVNLIYESKLGSINTSIDIEYSKADIEDKELKFPFNIPKKYERK